MERGRDTDVQCSGRGGSVCLLLCSTWIHPFLSAFHSHSLARSLCHCHARALSFFSPFSSLRSSPFHPRSFFFLPPAVLSSHHSSPSPHLCSTPLTSSLPPSLLCLCFIFFSHSLCLGSSFLSSSSSSSTVRSFTIFENILYRLY